MVGYDQEPEFPILAPGQKSVPERIEFEIRHGSGPLRRAVEAEGFAKEWAENERKAKL